MSKIITTCKGCNKQLEITKKHKKCVNLGCVEYNKIIRRNNAVRQNREEKKI